MFPHIPLQAITLDLADTRSISQTVEHILNNAIYIPETDDTSRPLNSAAGGHTPTTTSPPGAPDSQAPHTTPKEEGGSEVWRRRGYRAVTATDRENADSDSEIIRDDQSGASPPGVVEEEEEDPMAFSSLQRRKRELLAKARRLVSLAHTPSHHHHHLSLSFSLSLSLSPGHFYREDSTSHLLTQSKSSTTPFTVLYSFNITNY